MIQIFEYEDHSIQFDVIDGKVMANATLMATANGKKIADYLRLKSTVSYMDAVEKRYGDSHNDMVVVKQGGQDQGTWVTEKLIVDLSRWLSPDFAVWCDEVVSGLIKQKQLPATKPKTQVELLLESAQILAAQDARIENVENQVKILVAQTKTRPEYYTIVGYASLHGIEMGLKLAANLGKKCAAVCRMRNYPIEELPDPRFGRVKTYPYHVLEEVFNLNIV